MSSSSPATPSRVSPSPLLISSRSAGCATRISVRYVAKAIILQEIFGLVERRPANDGSVLLTRLAVP